MFIRYQLLLITIYLRIIYSTYNHRNKSITREKRCITVIYMILLHSTYSYLVKVGGRIRHISEITWGSRLKSAECRLQRIYIGTYLPLFVVFCIKYYFLTFKIIEIIVITPGYYCLGNCNNLSIKVKVFMQFNGKIITTITTNYSFITIQKKK